jgi:DNA helicase-2/ATP-dependent DNA helicase PcrA
LLINKNDDISLQRVINEPKRGLGDSSIEKFKAIATAYNISLYEAIKDNLEVIKEALK